ncbi:MAG: hypothetical protein AAFV88_08425 [Planctomycetota bacterium]
MIVYRLNRLLRFLFADFVWRSVLLGLPAAVAAIVMVVLLWTASQQTPGSLAERYLAASVKAHQQGDYETADLWVRRVLSLRPNDPGAQFHRAMNALASGRPVKASTIIAELAPEDRFGYAPAHYFIASQLIRLDSLELEDTERRVRFHLNAALTQDPEDAKSRHLAAEFELTLRNVTDAIQHYDWLSHADPAFHRLIAKLHVMRGDQESASRSANEGLRAFERRLQSNPTDVVAQIEIAKIRAFLEQYAAAAESLNRVAAYQHVAEDQAKTIRVTLSQIYHDWSLRIAADPRQDAEKCVKLLELSIRHSPKHGSPYQTLSQWRRADSSRKDMVDELIERLLQDRSVAPFVLVNLAIEAARNGDGQRERQLLEKALETESRLGVAANNLAWNLAQNQIDLPRALQLSNDAIKIDPKRYEFHATRGRILRRLDRPVEAIRELELAATHLHYDPSIAQTLTDLYQQIGLPLNPLRDSPHWMRRATSMSDQTTY